jgi:hypothetical protein
MQIEFLIQNANLFGKIRGHNVFSLSLSLSCANAVLQGLWGEPHQMPDMQRGDSFTAEAILGMK